MLCAYRHQSIVLLPLIINSLPHRQMTAANEVEKKNRRQWKCNETCWNFAEPSSRFLSSHKLTVDAVFIGDNFFCRVVTRPSENSYEAIINYVRIIMWRWQWRQRQHLTGLPLFQIRCTLYVNACGDFFFLLACLFFSFDSVSFGRNESVKLNCWLCAKYIGQATRHTQSEMRFLCAQVSAIRNTAHKPIIIPRAQGRPMSPHTTCHGKETRNASSKFTQNNSF